MQRGRHVTQKAGTLFDDSTLETAQKPPTTCDTLATEDEKVPTTRTSAQNCHVVVALRASIGVSSCASYMVVEIYQHVCVC